MKKYKITSFLLLAFFGSIIVCHLFFSKAKSDPIIGWNRGSIRMPIVLDTDPKTASFKSIEPREQRGIEFRRYLAASVRINAGGSFGSGTIVYYDKLSGWAYVASCGHLWSGTRSAEDLKNNPKRSKITVWYHNNKKLSKPLDYNAEVLFWSNSRGYDSSLLRFRPNWVPEYFPIALVDYKIENGKHYHSLGCDGAREVAHYDVKVNGIRGSDLITIYNSPRPGRSGGGLLSNDGYYIATCWGTSAYDGSGTGYFTPLSSIHKIYSKNGYSWLLKIPGGMLARKVPVRDWQFPNQKYNKDFIPIPGTGILEVPNVN